MAKKSIHKIGVVSVKELSPKRWMLRYTDPVTGCDIKRRLSGLDLPEIQRVAAHVSQEVLAEKGYVPGRAKGLPPIQEALATAIRLSPARPETKRNYAQAAALFLSWLRERYPRVDTWDRLRPSMVQEYVRDLEREGKSPDTVRLRLIPIRSAWRHVAENYEGVKPAPRIARAGKARREMVCLEPSEVAALLDWLRARHPDLWPMAVLQALAGLRMYEAAALRRQDVDLDKGTLAITETGHHVPKTRDSFRVIPASSEVIEALAEAMNRQRVIPSTGEIFLTQDGTLWRKNSLHTRWRKVRLTASVECELPRLLGIPPHRLRSSFVTMAGRLGVPDRLLKRYIGHAPGDTLGQHYRVIPLAELRLVSSRMEGWRHLIDYGDSGTILETLETECSARG